MNVIIQVLIVNVEAKKLTWGMIVKVLLGIDALHGCIDRKLEDEKEIRMVVVLVAS